METSALIAFSNLQLELELKRRAKVALEAKRAEGVKSWTVLTRDMIDAVYPTHKNDDCFDNDTNRWNGCMRCRLIEGEPNTLLTITITITPIGK